MDTSIEYTIYTGNILCLYSDIGSIFKHIETVSHHSIYVN